MVPSSSRLPHSAESAEALNRQQQLETEVAELRGEVEQLRQMVRALLGIVSAQEEQEEAEEPVIDYPERMNRQPRLRVGM